MSLEISENGSIEVDRQLQLLHSREPGLKGAGTLAMREPPNEDAATTNYNPRRPRHSECNGATGDLRHASGTPVPNNRQPQQHSVGFVEIWDTLPGIASGNLCLPRRQSSVGPVEIQGTMPNNVSTNLVTVLRPNTPDRGAQTVVEGPLVAIPIGAPLPRETRRTWTMEGSMSAAAVGVPWMQNPASCQPKASLIEWHPWLLTHLSTAPRRQTRSWRFVLPWTPTSSMQLCVHPTR